MASPGVRVVMVVARAPHRYACRGVMSVAFELPSGSVQVVSRSPSAYSMSAPSLQAQTSASRARTSSKSSAVA